MSEELKFVCPKCGQETMLKIEKIEQQGIKDSDLAVNPNRGVFRTIHKTTHKHQLDYFGICPSCLTEISIQLLIKDSFEWSSMRNRGMYDCGLLDHNRE